ncbi:CWC16 protein family-containing protein [Strongyloides ratti]|uniref:CWC16 protein family-containing protein n=1 Tax=Strongyloides ratti TaxID=34506 RepID=A0A090L115_STRRB|nr:CWC16 protein family-containing protein [Strongyloides ratti]CEF61164.1 CWC16 protein family-containing protein [Strongyloides ratti]
MGERKGQNKYYPPDFDYKKHKTLNAYHGTTSLRDRGCDSHVGMGVRFNAEKRKVGNYYSTPIYEFDMKCMYCDSHYIIRTDPKNFDYEIISGARRQHLRKNISKNEIEEETDDKVDNNITDDKMKKLNHLQNDFANSKKVIKDVEILEQYNERMKDDYKANSLARDLFRKQKNEIRKIINNEEGLKHSLGLAHITLPPEKEIDTIMANSLVKTQCLANAYATTSVFSKRETLIDKLKRKSNDSYNFSFKKKSLESPKFIQLKKKEVQIKKEEKTTSTNTLLPEYSSESES